MLVLMSFYRSCRSITNTPPSLSFFALIYGMDFGMEYLPSPLKTPFFAFLTLKSPLSTSVLLIRAVPLLPVPPAMRTVLPTPFEEQALLASGAPPAMFDLAHFHGIKTQGTLAHPVGERPISTCSITVMRPRALLNAQCTFPY